MPRPLRNFLLCLLALSGIAATPPGKKPRNIILMIGDGTGLAQLCAAYAANGFYLDIFALAQVVGLMNTSSSDDFITDSAAGATAMASGQKTRNLMLGLDPDSNFLPTISEKAHRRGLSTGIVTTCGLTHATPAAFYAHRPSRYMDSAIAADFYDCNTDIAIGGGKYFFDSALLAQKGFAVNTGLSRILACKVPRQMGFFSDSLHPPRMLDGRGPFLEKSSLHAISLLSLNRRGFFLMIEGSQIDWGGHENDSAYVLTETLDFSACAKKVIDWARKDGNTLVIITADHETGGLGLMGYDSLHMRPEMKFLNREHSGIMVPVFAFGPGAKEFGGVYQNTEIYHRMQALLKLDK